MPVYRMAMAQLHEWKMKKRHKPLIIRGSRQVGKTWLMKEFGAKEYTSTVYINFDNNQRMKALFEGGLEVERLVTGLELYAGHKIDPENTLLIWCFGSLCGSKSGMWLVSQGGALAPPWLLKSTATQGCQDRRRRGATGALTALWHGATSCPLFGPSQNAADYHGI